MLRNLYKRNKSENKERDGTPPTGKPPPNSARASSNSSSESGSFESHPQANQTLPAGNLLQAQFARMRARSGNESNMLRVRPLTVDVDCSCPQPTSTPTIHEHVEMNVTSNGHLRNPSEQPPSSQVTFCRVPGHHERHHRSSSASPHITYTGAAAIPGPPIINTYSVPPSTSMQGLAARISSGGARRGSIPGGSRLLSPLGPAKFLNSRHEHPTVFDFEEWHTSLTGKNQDAVYALFMKAHKCYDLIPTSSKLVVFDTQLPVRKAFFALVYNGVRAAPLWDSAKQEFVGMLTITDFIHILHRYYKRDGSDGAKELEEHKISTWRETFESDGRIRSLITVDPAESLYKAVETLCESKVHRLPVMEKGTGNVSYILTHKRLIKFLYLYIEDLPRPSFMMKTPKELNIGAWGDVSTISTDTLLIDALRTFLEKRVSALPLVDADGKVVDLYAKFDVINLAAEKAYNNLDVTVHEALKHRSEWFEGVRSCAETDNLMTVIEIIVKAEVHRLIVTDSEKRVVGIVSLSDILRHLILEPQFNSAQDGESEKTVEDSIEEVENT